MNLNACSSRDSAAAAAADADDAEADADADAACTAPAGEPAGAWADARVEACGAEACGAEACSVSELDWRQAAHVAAARGARPDGFALLLAADVNTGHCRP